MDIGMLNCLLVLRKGDVYADCFIGVPFAAQSDSPFAVLQDMWKPVLVRLQIAAQRGWSFQQLHITTYRGDDAKALAKSYGGDLDGDSWHKVLHGPMHQNPNFERGAS